MRPECVAPGGHCRKTCLSLANGAVALAWGLAAYALRLRGAEKRGARVQWTKPLSKTASRFSSYPKGYTLAWKSQALPKKGQSNDNVHTPRAAWRQLRPPNCTWGMNGNPIPPYAMRRVGWGVNHSPVSTDGLGTTHKSCSVGTRVRFLRGQSGRSSPRSQLSS